ncbi:LacI family DNA-binding transcriptional regulator [Rubellicoccus peritrichatus]|uniref:LacI family DNA-binding transcriptional regulator n=1 Tax=Rubellicoccus peritrichatus TaxID=3080537 RepID=A0AAQ3L8P2_9BACT|nr:LacI family DNA-binding transcriptional regulator [Puniceicoccus sp. CR14]WOO41375.1 LacI family DNA-binding transcriptional regulator [Puniceicoccus sp. CR14]
MPAKGNSDRPNMQHIADAAGVSKSAVSLALKNDPRLPEATRERIQQIAADMGYQRNPVMAGLMAQLRASRTPKFQANLAWLNCAETQDMMQWHTFKNFRKGAKERAQSMGYGLEDFWLGEQGMSAARLAQILNARSIRGVIAAAAQVPGNLHDGYDAFWDQFSCCVVGIANFTPRLPAAIVDHYQVSMLAAQKALEAGYQKPALVLEHALDELLIGRFSAGFHSVVKDLPSNRIAPVHPFDWREKQAFLKWFKEHKPDVIVTAHTDVRKWIDEAGISVPETVGLIHLDLEPEMSDWAGVKQHNEQVGANAADLVIAQITRAETGAFANPKIMMINSDWEDGPSIKKKQL